MSIQRIIDLIKSSVETGLVAPERGNRAISILNGEAYASKRGVYPLVELWNIRTEGIFHVVKGLGPTRKKSMNARWSEMPDIGYWQGIIDRVLKSDFCRGQNDRNWQANFDWLIRPETRIRIEEGFYDNRNGPIKKPPTKEDKVFEAALKKALNQ